MLLRRVVQIITGANGLIGSFLSYKLLQGTDSVLCIVRSKKGKQELLDSLHVFNRFYKTTVLPPQFVFGDVLDYYFLEDLFQAGDTVFHTAACVSFNSSDRDLMFKTNIEGTANVVNAGVEKGIKKLCYISSVAAIGRDERGLVIDENTAWENGKHNSHYAISKYNAELEVWRGSLEGLKTFIVNPSIVLGFTNNGKSSSSIFHQIKKGFPFKSNGVNGFVGVKDVVDAIINLDNAGLVNERFVLNSENLTYAKVFETIALKMGKKPIEYAVKPWMKWVVLPLAKIQSFITRKSPFITQEVFSKAFSKNTYSAKKIRDVIGFQFTPVAQIIDETVEMMS